MHFDVGRLQDDLHALTYADWKKHYQARHYEGDWSALPLRSVNGETENILVSPFENAIYQDTSLLGQCPYFMEVLEHFHCPIKGVRLLRLKAGSMIKEHRDHDLCFEKGEIRIHIPIVTHEAVEFLLDGERISLRVGECWYMNFNLRHAIRNNSPIDRVHLVLDAIVNEWVTELFSRQGLNKKVIDDPDYDESTKKQIIENLRKLNTETASRLADEMEGSFSSKQS